MLFRIVVVIGVCGSFGMAASNWSVPATNSPAMPAADVGDAISTIVFARAGRSSTRIAAGLSGDWATAAMDETPPAAASGPQAARAKFVLRPLDAALTEHASDDPVFASPAAALPLPPGALAALPGLLLAVFTGRRFVRL